MKNLKREKIEKRTKTHPWLEKPMRGQMICQNNSVRVIVCPDKKTAGILKDIDVILLELKNAKHERRNALTKDFFRK